MPRGDVSPTSSAIKSGGPPSFELDLVHAKLANVEAALQPHFLFNTLNAIAEWCRADGAVAEKAIVQLSSMLRTMMTGIQSTTWPLAKELESPRRSSRCTPSAIQALHRALEVRSPAGRRRPTHAAPAARGERDEARAARASQGRGRDAGHRRARLVRSRSPTRHLTGARDGERARHREKAPLSRVRGPRLFRIEMEATTGPTRSSSSPKLVADWCYVPP